jgi:L-2-hydroxyglutarate oxidase LhgO
MDELDAVVIGAGVVGLAAARALALRGREVVILEAESGIGTGTSSRNSEVIHAGIYYPRDSFKARFCVQGRQALYAYCADRAIPHRRCGKLIVATLASQEAALETLLAQANANGVTDLVRLTAGDARVLEPALHCTAALLSPSTGIIDSHALMVALLADAEANGATLAFKSPVTRGAIAVDGIELAVGGDDPVRVKARTVINAGGLLAQAVAASLDGFPHQHVPPTFFCKGNYFTLGGRPVFSRLIYPIPERAGLGVHVTLDLAGQMRFGPDVEWVDAIDYSVDPHRGDRFYAAIRTYWPELPEGALVPGYAGIRPKLGGPDAPASDFVIQGPATHGVPGLVNLFGIESPGLTASIAMAEYVCELLA